MRSGRPAAAGVRTAAGRGAGRRSTVPAAKPACEPGSNALVWRRRRRDAWHPAPLPELGLPVPPLPGGAGSLLAGLLRAAEGGGALSDLPASLGRSDGLLRTLSTTPTPSQATSASAPGSDGGRPVVPHLVLRVGERDLAGADEPMQPVLEPVFHRGLREWLRPEIVDRIGAAELARDQVVELISRAVGPAHAISLGHFALHRLGDLPAVGAPAGGADLSGGEWPDGAGREEEEQ